MAFEWISRDPEIMAGVPCVKGTRIPVGSVVTYAGDGLSVESIVADFRWLSVQDVMDALRFGVWSSLLMG